MNWIKAHKIQIGIGVIAIIILFSIYNCIVSDDRSSALTPEQEEQAAQETAAIKDTFDVVGDYLFPAMGNSRDELMTDEEREGKKEADKSKEQTKTVTEGDVADDDIIESADISSDTKPAPPAPAPKAPETEQLESPKVTPVE